MRANISKDGNVYSITSALRPGGANKSPRSRCIALTDCIVYDREGNVTKVIPRHAPATRKNTPRTKVVKTSAARRDIILQATMGSIHTDDQ